MEKRYLGSCRYCKADITYQDGASLVKCISCGETLDVAGFLNDQIRLEEVQKEGAEAREALKKAEAELEEAKNTVFRTVSSLGQLEAGQAEQQAQLLEVLRNQHRIQDSLESRLTDLREAVSQTDHAVRDFEKLWKQSELNKLSELYHQAENMQEDRRFDDAEELYRQVVINGGKDPAVYWRILLCHYCVIWQTDNEDKRILTILYPDLSDPEELSARKDLLACNLTDEQRAYYQQELKKLDTLLDRYRAVHHQVQYDVFISVKQTVWLDDKKFYTADQKMGATLYEHLTSRGLRVFNSEAQACKCPPGQEWEPYILSALLSSRVMIVVGTCREYMESQWVKNEWSRFQWLQKHEKEAGARPRKLFCYISDGMNPYDIPRGLNPDQQAIVNGALAFEQLDKALDGVFGTEPSDTISDPMPKDILAKMEIWLAMGKFDLVSKEYEQLVRQGKHLTVSRIHLYAICADQQVRTPLQLAEVFFGLQQDKRFELARKFAKTEEEKAEISSILKRREELDQRIAETQETQDPADGSISKPVASPSHFTFSINEAGGAVITGFTADISELVIPETLQNYPVVQIEDEAFSNCDILTSVIFPSGLQAIGTRAFFGCDSLRKVSFPDHLTRISAWAFAQCYSLTEVSFGRNLADIGDYAFFNCHSLEQLCLPEGLIKIGSYSFSKCSSLAAADIPENTRKLGVQAFSNCSQLSQVRLPASLVEIGAYAFWHCAPRFSVEIIPGTYAETWCGENNIPCVTPFRWADKGKTMELVSYSGNKKNVTVPAKIQGKPVESIAGNCFHGNTFIREIHLPDGLKTIGSDAFSKCRNLEMVSLPPSLTTIDYMAFSGCHSLKEITIPGRVLRIANSLFENCRSLRKVVLSSGVQYIGKKSFLNCSSLEEAVLPGTLRRIGMLAFSRCTSLREIQIPDGVYETEPNIFADCVGLKRVSLPASLQHIGSDPFIGCSHDLICVVAPDSTAAKWCRVQRIRTIASTGTDPQAEKICPRCGGKLSRFTGKCKNCGW